jgi:hypothetical protein
MAIAHTLTPYLFTGLVGLAYVRRIAANFGRQPWRPVRTGIRLGLLSLALLALLLAAAFVPRAALAVGVGMFAGGTLAGFALYHNHAEIVDGKRCYTPNPWIGGGLSLLLVGRLLWRMGHVDMATMASGSAGFGQQASPLTLGIAATLVTFYVVNSIGLFVQMGRLAAPPVEPFINP